MDSDDTISRRTVVRTAGADEVLEATEEIERYICEVHRLAMEATVELIDES